MIELGQEVQDKITGFRGIVTGRVDYLTGCRQLLIAPPLKSDGRMAESVWLDEQRCEPVPGGRHVVIDNGQTPGCDIAPPVR